MNPQSNTKIREKNPSIVDACTESNPIIIRKQSISVLTNIFQKQKEGKSPPGCSRSSGSSLPRAAAKLIHAACKGYRINNKEEIINNKSKEYFIF